MEIRKLMVAVAVAGALFAGVSRAQGAPDPAPGGWGMMGGGGPGMMGGYGHGYGMGPGMMGGYGGGPGMMGGGAGMMGGGCPMMGVGPLWELNLSADQKKKLDALMSQQRDLHWSIMRALSDDYGKLHTLYSADPLDQAAIDKVYDDINKNQRAMIDSGIKARNQIYAMLTPDQKNQLKQYGRGPGNAPAPGK